MTFVHTTFDQSSSTDDFSTFKQSGSLGMDRRIQDRCPGYQEEPSDCQYWVDVTFMHADDLATECREFHAQFLWLLA